MQNIENTYQEMPDDELPEEEEIIEGQASDPEPEHEEQSEETPENDDSAEEEEQQESNHNDYVDKSILNKVRRENFRYLNKIQELQNQLAMRDQEAVELRYVNDVATQTAMNHYESAAKERLDRAKDMRLSALESGDPKTIADTDVELSKAVYEYEKLRNYKAEQQFQNESEQTAAELRYQAQQNSPYNPYPAKPNLTEENMATANDWAAKNDWFKTNSKNYDAIKHDIANQVLDNLDKYCYDNGLGNLIGSREYFDTLDQQLNNYPQFQKGTNMPRQQTQKSYSQQPQRSNMVAPARGRTAPTSYNGGSQKQNTPLSAAEKNMIQRLGVTEESYRFHKQRKMKDDYFGDQLMQYQDKGR
jgi:hypothetical protein